MELVLFVSAGCLIIGAILIKKIRRPKKTVWVSPSWDPDEWRLSLGTCGHSETDVDDIWRLSQTQCFIESFSPPFHWIGIDDDLVIKFNTITDKE